KGEVDGELRVEDCPKNKTGTVQRWKSDREVFTDINIQKEFFLELLKKQAVVNKGLTLSFKWQNPDGSFDKSEFLYENGIVDYIKEIAGEDYITPPVEFSTEREGRDRADKDLYKLKIHFAFCFSNKVNKIEYYHNSSFLEHGGSPDKATRSAFVWAIDRYAKANAKYTKNESKITYADIEEVLVLIVNSFSTQTSYENQTKKAITNVFITKAMTEFFKHSLEVYFAENPLMADKICSQVLINKRARESSESMKMTTKIKLSVPLDISNSVDKFVNCRSKDPERCELYIVEGDSALSSCKLARNAEFQAIIPVRGKTLNCLKSTYDKILSNDIIVDLLKVLGCGIEIKGGKSKKLPEFNINALRWNKIIICTDADEDGYQIRTLIMTMLYRLLPTLIREGRVFIAETPLYEINTKDKTLFAYDDREKSQIIDSLGDKKYTIQRSKGLGENDPEMMSRTTMHPATRKLIRIKPEDEQSTYDMFDVLLGDNISGRKQFISENGARYLAMADL
ncbi:MAG TPA: DNA topoisomerase, partial [Clostridiales bacterium]|nr:DNA topoisomerase [Clostridiales bacterium]